MAKNDKETHPSVFSVPLIPPRMGTVAHGIKVAKSPKAAINKTAILCLFIVWSLRYWHKTMVKETMLVFA